MPCRVICVVLQRNLVPSEKIREEGKINYHYSMHGYRRDENYMIYKFNVFQIVRYDRIS